jgi:hypothetical protein
MSVLELDVSSEVSVAEIDQIELASFARMVVSDPELRAVFASDPAAAIAQTGVTLSSTARDAVIQSAGQLLSITSDIDNPITAAFFLIIIVRG